MALLVVAYETTTGKWYFQRLGSAQLSPQALDSIALFAPNLFAGGSGLAVFADGFWSGSAALGKFGAGLFTADATGRAKFADAFLVSGLVAAGAIGGGLIADQNILSGKYAPQSIRTADLGPGQVVSSIIGANVIGTPHIQNQGILSASIGANVLDTAHIRNQGILSAAIAGLAVGTPHLALNAVVSGKLGSGAIPDSSGSEGQLVSGISIDIAESISEPTPTTAEPISGHACVVFLSGYNKLVGVALANNPNRMPAVGKIGPTALTSGAAMAANPLLTFGRQTSPIGSGNVGRPVYVGVDAQPTITAPSASGSCVQAIGAVMGNDGTLLLFPQPFFIQVAA